MLQRKHVHTLYVKYTRTSTEYSFQKIYAEFVLQKSKKKNNEIVLNFRKKKRKEEKVKKKGSRCGKYMALISFINELYEFRITTANNIIHKIMESFSQNFVEDSLIRLSAIF